MARIYIADDDPDIRYILSSLLAEEGHDVFPMLDGGLAFDSLMADPPDLLVLDVMMPAMDGYEVLRLMKNSRACPSTRVLVLTARASKTDEEQAYSYGADGYMAKPFDPDEFVKAVADLLSTSPEELAARRGEDPQAALMSQLQSLLDSD
jgi:DNA-binding response OmpR family regulator